MRATQPVKQDLVTKDTDMFVLGVTMEINVNGVGERFTCKIAHTKKKHFNRCSVCD